MIFLADFSVIKPDVGLMVWTVIIFGLFWFLVSRLAFRPITEALEARDLDIQSALEDAKKAKESMQNIKSENEKVISDARMEQANILKEARAAKDKIVNDAKNEAKVEANKIVSSARTDIDEQKATAMTSVKKESGYLALTIAEKLIKKQLMGNDDEMNFANGLIDDIKLN